MRTVEKPWGHEIVWAETEKYTAKELHINAGHRLSLQYHEKKDETIRVMQGKLYLHHRLESNLLGDGPLQIDELSVGDCYRVLPGRLHRFEARDEDVVLCEVSTPELDDVVRVEDDYERN